MTDAHTLSLGVLGKPHGLRGDLALRLYNPQGRLLERVAFPVQVVLTDEDSRRAPATLRGARRAGNDLLVRFVGVETREQAALLTHRHLHVPRASLPPLASGECYVEDLLGLRVTDVEGRDRGVVAEAFFNGAHDILTVKDAGGAEILVPVVPDFIRQVDLGAGYLLVDTHE